MVRILIIPFIFIFASNVWSEDCNKAVELYNQTSQATELEGKERGFKEAVNLPSTGGWR